MAATVTNAWGKPGAWALDSEEHEDELNRENPPTPATGNNQSAADFPDLTTAAATKTTKKKKGKPLSLGEFVTGSTHKPAAHTYQAAKGLTAEDMMKLPTGPRERTAEELDRSRLGGGFRSYGGGDRNNNDSSNSRWGSNRSTNGGGDEGFRKSSRADETDDWGAQKKSPASGAGGGFDRKEKSGFFEGSNSRADESDRWVSNKSHAPPSESRRNVRSESSGGADSSENWGKKKEEERGRFGAFDSLRERRSGSELSDSDNWGRKREEAIGGGSMSRPKLNLQPRKLPVAVVDGGGDTAELKGNKGSNSNPFGDARPREEVLKEKGKDWREIDEKLESMKVKEVGSVDGPKRGFRTGAGIEDQSEKSWRKNVSPESAENSEIGNAEEAEGEEAHA